MDEWKGIRVEADVANFPLLSLFRREENRDGLMHYTAIDLRLHLSFNNFAAERHCRREGLSKLLILTEGVSGVGFNGPLKNRRNVSISTPLQ